MIHFKNPLYGFYAVTKETNSYQLQDDDGKTCVGLLATVQTITTHHAHV